MYSNSRGQNLIQHQVAVAKLAEAFIMQLGITDSDVIRDTVISAFFHDIGKAISFFQEYMTSKQLYPDTSNEHAYSEVYEKKIHNVDVKKLNEYPRHHEISWALLSTYLIEDVYSNALYAVYWHHSKPVGEKQVSAGEYSYTGNGEILKALSDEDYDAVKNHFMGMVDLFNTLYPQYAFTIGKEISSPKTIPVLFAGEDRNNDSDVNAIRLLVRFCTCVADRKISAFSQEEIKSFITGDREASLYATSFTNLPEVPRDRNTICIKPESYGEDRFNIQVQCATEASQHRCAAVKAPAGFGKSMIAVLFSIMNQKQTFIVCPRNSIVSAVYESVVKELESLKIHRSVEAYYEGDQQKCNMDGIKAFSADIVVTNIDNVLMPTFSNRHAAQFHVMLNSTVIFDEYHELFQNKEAMTAAVVTFMRARNRYCVNSKTLLMSATPIPIWTMWDTYDCRTAVLPNDDMHYPAAHDKKYVFTVLEGLPAVLPKNSALLFNSIKSSQNAYRFIQAEELIHSKFFDAVKREKLGRIRGVFKKGGDVEKKDATSVISARMLQAAEDISFKTLFVSKTAIRSLFQIMGRGNRFGDYDSCSVFYIKLDKGHVMRGSEDRASALFEPSDILKLWDSFFEDMLKEKSEYTLDELYCKYNEFHIKYKKEIIQSMKAWYGNSASTMSKFDMTLPKRKYKETFTDALKMKVKRKFGLRECGGYFYTIKDNNGNWIGVDNVLSAGEPEFARLYDINNSGQYSKGELYRDLVAVGYSGFDEAKDKIVRGSVDRKKLLKQYAKKGITPFPVFTRIYDYVLGVIDDSADW